VGKKKRFGTKKLFGHFDLTMFCLSVFALFANAPFSHHIINKIKTLLGNWLT